MTTRYIPSTIKKAASDWWAELGPVKNRSGRQYPGQRATLAKLRRAAGDPLAAAVEPATIELYRRLGLVSADASRTEKAAMLTRVAVLASILAHVRKNSADKVGRALGPPPGAKNGEGAAMSQLRLARLLAARGDEEIATAFRRAVMLLKNGPDVTANVGDLAWLILTWDRGELGDRTRTLFAFDYHNASAHAPSGDLRAEPAAENTNT